MGLINELEQAIKDEEDLLGVLSEIIEKSERATALVEDFGVALATVPMKLMYQAREMLRKKYEGTEYNPIIKKAIAKTW